jgi:general secretion pathway protein A
MYSRFYGFTTEPFQNTPDLDFLFLSTNHKEALACVEYGIRQRKGFIAITGEAGVGKTIILRSYLTKVDAQKQKTLYILNPRNRKRFISSIPGSVSTVFSRPFSKN